MLLSAFTTVNWKTSSVTASCHPSLQQAGHFLKKQLLCLVVSKASHLECMMSVANRVLLSVTTVPPPLKRLMTCTPACLACSVWISCSGFLHAELSSRPKLEGVKVILLGHCKGVNRLSFLHAATAAMSR